MKIAGIILAGGLATRMGGGDKGLIEVDGESILERVIKTITPQVDELKINANGDVSRFQSFGLEVVSDTVEGFVGPLAGVLAGMDAFKEYDYLLSVPTDTPFLPDDLVGRLLKPIEQDGVDITMAASNGFDHPVIALWPIRLADELRSALIEEDIRKIKRWVGRYRYQSVEWDIDGDDPFFNANSPGDIEKLR